MTTMISKLAFPDMRRSPHFFQPVSALPETGKPMMEKWLGSPNKNIRWVMNENLKKNRLVRMDANWVKGCIKILR